MKALRLLALVILVILLPGCTDSLIQATPTALTPTSVPTGAPAALAPLPAEPTAGTASAPSESPSVQAFRITEEPTTQTAAPTLLSSTPPPAPANSKDELIIPSPTIAAGEAPTATLAAQLQGTVVSRVPPTLTPDVIGMSPFSGIDNVRTFRLHGLSGGDYWAAYSTGSRNTGGGQQQPQRHFVAVYRHTADGWNEAGRVELDSPDFLSEGGVTQIEIEPSHVWLAVESGAGAHGGCYDVLSFDGTTLSSAVSHCASSPGAGHLEDLNGDGENEVVLNNSDNYVLCYACSVRLVRMRVLRWNGQHLVEAEPQRLPVSAESELRSLNDRAVDLFRHEMIKDAVAAIGEAVEHSPSNQTVAWNSAIIRLHAQARAQHAKESGYPLLARLFCGDYEGALKLVRPYTVDQIFAADSPLVTGTLADEWRPELVQWITSTTTLAIEVEPDLPGPYFLRGWAGHLANPDSPDAVRDIERAALLAPTDTLFSDSLAYLRRAAGTNPSP